MIKRHSPGVAADDVGGRNSIEHECFGLAFASLGAQEKWPADARAIEAWAHLLREPAMSDASTAPLAAYLLKLGRRVELTPEDREALLELPVSIRHVEAQTTIVKEGKEAKRSIFLLEGLVSRQRLRHQTGSIISISFPGDAVDLQTLLFPFTDHALVAHVATTFAMISHDALIDLCDRRPSVAKLLWHDTLVDSAIFREWAMNIGHRRAHDRIGYLFLECEARLAAIGQSHNDTFQLPLTQQELAGALGLSLVHMNKSLRRLRESGAIAMPGRDIRILDKASLKEEVGFDGDYLHLNERPSFYETTVPHPPISVSVAE